MSTRSSPVDVPVEVPPPPPPPDEGAAGEVEVVPPPSVVCFLQSGYSPVYPGGHAVAVISSSWIAVSSRRPAGAVTVSVHAAAATISATAEMAVVRVLLDATEVLWECGGGGAGNKRLYGDWSESGIT